MSVRFRSRVDPLVAVLLLTPVLLPVGYLMREGGDWGLGPAVALCAALGGSLWLLFDTSYTVTDRDLLIRGGPVRATVPLASIRRVRRSRTLLSAPALSFRRLEIEYGTAAVAVISPEREAEFLALLQERVPEAELPPVG